MTTRQNLELLFEGRRYEENGNFPAAIASYEKAKANIGVEMNRRQDQDQEKKSQCMNNNKHPSSSSSLEAPYVSLSDVLLFELCMGLGRSCHSIHRHAIAQVNYDQALHICKRCTYQQ
jgi:hypothetical protein